eukprot:EG_transcript_13072
MYRAPAAPVFLPYGQPVATSVPTAGLSWGPGAGFPAMAQAVAQPVGRAAAAPARKAPAPQPPPRPGSQPGTQPLRRTPSMTSLSSATGDGKRIMKTPHQVLVVFQDTSTKKNRQHQIVRVSKREDLLSIIESHPSAAGRKVEKVCVATWSGQETYPLDANTWADVCQGSRLIRAFLTPVAESATLDAVSATGTSATPPSDSLASENHGSKRLSEVNSSVPSQGLALSGRD